MKHYCNTLMCSISYMFTFQSSPFKYLATPEGFIRRYRRVYVKESLLQLPLYTIEEDINIILFHLQQRSVRIASKTTFLFLFPPAPAARNPLFSRLGGENRFHPICQARERLFSIGNVKCFLTFYPEGVSLENSISFALLNT
jgi:hypothetical protein